MSKQGQCRIEVKNLTAWMAHILLDTRICVSWTELGQKIIPGEKYEQEFEKISVLRVVA